MTVSFLVSIYLATKPSKSAVSLYLYLYSSVVQNKHYDDGLLVGAFGIVFVKTTPRGNKGKIVLIELSAWMI